MTNEKDSLPSWSDCEPAVDEKRATLLERFIYEYEPSNNDDEWRERLLAVLTAIRKEEQEAAFKVLCPECTENDVPILDQQAKWFYHRWGDEQVGCSASKLRIAALEAAADTKGEG